MPKAPSSRSPSTTSGGTLPVRSISSPSTCSRRSFQRVQERPGPRLLLGVRLGEGMDEVEAEPPREQLATKLRPRHSVSRAASATSRASWAVALVSFIFRTYA